jgi:hypothetical protein
MVIERRRLVALRRYREMERNARNEQIRMPCHRHLPHILNPNPPDDTLPLWNNSGQPRGCLSEIIGTNTMVIS